MEALRNSSAYSVFKNFEAISQIPRCSNDEEKIVEYVYQFGKKLGLETSKDEFGNILIIKPATEGYGSHETVVLQAHVDMVCEKTEDSMHNFSCDPINLQIDGDLIHAKDTTLGSDDGIGVALMMAILENNKIEHPRLECLFTTTEETGMDGALGLSDQLLTGKHLINLDNEEDWIVIVGCAGGINSYLTLDFDYQELPDLSKFKIKVSGLQGGHSGSMIGESRGNAIKILDSVLLKVKKQINFKLQAIQGGSKHNAIPSLAYADIAVNTEDIENLTRVFTEVSYEIKNQNIKRELDLQITLEPIHTYNDKYIDDVSSAKILKIISTFPHGVNTVDRELDIVKSSNNLAIVQTKKDQFLLQTSIRSSDLTDMDFLKNEVKNQAENNGFGITFSEGYPMWKPNFDNPLLNKAKEVYRQVSGKEIEVLVIHAGLETGILSEKYPEMNMIAIGPTILGAHTPRERLSISSTELVFEYLKTLIKNL